MMVSLLVVMLVVGLFALMAMAITVLLVVLVIKGRGKNRRGFPPVFDSNSQRAGMDAQMVAHQAATDVSASTAHQHTDAGPAHGSSHAASHGGFDAGGGHHGGFDAGGHATSGHTGHG
jgi:hypothetical protein